MESLSNKAGIDRGGLLWFEEDIMSVLYYNPSTLAVAQFYNGTRFPSPATTTAGGSNMYFATYNVTFQVCGVFYSKTMKNNELTPTIFPWTEYAALIEAQFGLPPGSVENMPYCTETTSVNCAKPGYVYNGYPFALDNSVGSQSDGLQIHSRENNRKRDSSIIPADRIIGFSAKHGVIFV
jgi:hypothetical protein